MTAKKTSKNKDLSADVSQDIAQTFVNARLAASGLSEYPGPTPADLAQAYAIQDRAIDLWPDTLRGWKVGRIPPALEDAFGCDRLAGPIFEKAIRRHSNGHVTDMAVYSDGFAAIEAEFVVVIGDDAPPDKVDWSRDEAEAMIGELRVGLEIASSPLPTINALGPAVTASDFGNNAGLLVGPTIGDWSNRDPRTLTCASYIDDELAGEGGAYLLTGGVVRSVQFLLELTARRGLPLVAGSLVATGQTSGIHEVTPGQLVRIEFGGGDDGEVACRIVAAQAS